MRIKTAALAATMALAAVTVSAVATAILAITATGITVGMIREIIAARRNGRKRVAAFPLSVRQRVSIRSQHNQVAQRYLVVID